MKKNITFNSKHGENGQKKAGRLDIDRIGVLYAGYQAQTSDALNSFNGRKNYQIINIYRFKAFMEQKHKELSSNFCNKIRFTGVLNIQYH